MKDFFSTSFYDNTVGEWIAALLIIIGGALLGRFIYWFIGKYIKRWTQKSKYKFDDILIDMIEEPVSLTIVLTASWYAIGMLHLSANCQNFTGHVFYILITFNVAWLLVRLIDAIILEYLVPLAANTKSTLDDQLLPILRKSIKVAIWILAFIVGLDNAGYNIGALLAGMGIGGIALAMAAKDTVSNFFGGFTVFIDKPFAVKDRIVIEDIDGIVEEIGIRSTRIRNLNGRVVTIPNSIFTSNKIENISSEPCRKISLSLGLNYNTSPDRMKFAIEILKEIVSNNIQLENKIAVGFTNFGDFSLNINLNYYIKTDADIIEVQSEINQEILNRFNAEKLEFAFPTQTIYTLGSN
jgi:MscS family membrane protein